MPVLAAETQFYPPSLFAAGSHDNDPWWVLQTKPRCEKALARSLVRERVGYFLPQGQSRRRYQRRWVTTHLPLFPGYLFMRGTEDARITAIQTNKVVSILEVNDQERLHAELTALHQVVNSGEEVSAEPQLPEGAKVEVIRGALSGVCGIVSRCDGSSRIIVEVKMLNRGVSVQVEDWMLQKI